MHKCPQGFACVWRGQSVGTHLARLGLAPQAPGDAARFFFSFPRVLHQAVRPDLLEGPNFEAVGLPLGGSTQAAHLWGWLPTKVLSQLGHI